MTLDSKAGNPACPDVNHQKKRPPYPLLFGAAAILVAGLVVYHLKRQYHATIAQWEARQNSIADDRSRMVSEWFKERRYDAEALASRYQVIAALTPRHPRGTLPGVSPVSAPALERSLARYAQTYGYEAIFLVDPQGGAAGQSTGASDLDAASRAAARETAQTGEPRVTLTGGAPQNFQLSFSAPVFAEELGGLAGRAPKRPLGAVVIRVQLAHSLFSLLLSESVPTRSGETLLACKQGEKIVFISPLRHIAIEAAGFHRPYAGSRLPVRAALDGKELFGEFTDYRGVPVLASTRRIPATGWGLVRKIDRAEALEGFRRAAWWEGLAAVLLLAIFGGMLFLQRRYADSAAIRNEREKFRVLLESAPDAMVIIDHIGRMVLVNSAVETMFGYPRSELLGQPFLMLVPERFRPERAKFYASLFEDSSPRIEQRQQRRWGLRKDGQEFPAEVTISAFGTLEGRVVAISIRDVTERQQAEEALRRASAYNRSLIEASLDPLVTVSPEGKITDVNAATEKATGRARQDLMGTDFCDYFTDPEKARAGYQQVLQEGQVQDYALEIRHTEGRTTPVLYNATVYRDEAGEVIGVFAAARDITERKRAEDALRESEERQRLAVEGARLGVWFWNIGQNHLVWTPRCKEIFGLKPDQEISYEGFLKILHPEDREPTDRAVHLAIEAQADYEVEYRAIWPDGTVHWIAALGRGAYNDRGEPVRMLGVVIDITDRKNAEEAVRRLTEELEQRVRSRTAELEVANKELEAFTYSVSHDLRAPLRHIDGFSQLLVEEYGPQLPEEVQRYLARIQAGVRQMGRLVDDLLNLARLGRQEVRLQVTGLGSLVEEVVGEMKLETTGRTIDWKIRPLPFVECDPPLLKQVFANLLSNAVKFTSPRQQAVIEVGFIRPDGERAVYVRDNGVGFSMKYADKLFGVFQRLHRAEDFEGTGVGLATVQRIIHKHGGRVWAESELDQGAAFYFTLGRSGLEGAHVAREEGEAEHVTTKASGNPAGGR